jgi:hypothetical protein
MHLCDVFIFVKFISVQWAHNVWTYTRWHCKKNLKKKTILNQNYTQHIDHQYIQNARLAMGAPTSAILAEIFMQYLEHNHIINIL